MGHWTAARWATSVPATPPAPADVAAQAPGTAGVAAQAPGTAGSTTRADVVFALTQLLADLDADAEGRPHRPVPRLDGAQALVDQVRVMVADLLRSPAPPSLLREAVTATDAATRAL